MDAVIIFLLIAAVIALIVAQIGGAIGALFFGRKLPWIWFALAVLVLVMKVTHVALYRENDGIRAIVSLVAGFLAAGLALLAQRHFPNAVLLVGGFLAAGLTAIQVLGPLLNPLPQWLVIALLVAAGVAGALWTRTNRDTATIVLSALIGAGVLTDEVVDLMQIDEASRFQVYAVIALTGMGFQFWQERRERKTRVRAGAGSVSMTASTTSSHLAPSARGSLVVCDVACGPGRRRGRLRTRGAGRRPQLRLRSCGADKPARSA